MLIRYLPPDSALGRAINGAAWAEWTDEKELLASLVDVANYHRWLYHLATYKGVTKRPPKPITRPEMPHHLRRARRGPRRRHASRAEMSRMFGIPLRPGYDVATGGDQPQPRALPETTEREDDERGH